MRPLTLCTLSLTTLSQYIYYGRPKPCSSKKEEEGAGISKKNGASFDTHQEAVAAITLADPTVNETSASANNPTDDDPPQQTSKKQRRDDNWRSGRSLKSAKKKTEKVTSERDQLKEENVAIRRKLKEAEAAEKQSIQKNYLQEKEHRKQALKTEEDHKSALTELRNKLLDDTLAAYEDLDKETQNRIAVEQLRILEQQSTKEWKDKQDKKRKTALNKEKRGREKAMADLQLCWKREMKRNLSKQEAKHVQEIGKLQQKMKANDEQMMNDRVVNQQR